MRKRRLSTPLIGAIAVTRGLLGAGVGLLASERLARRRRRSIGLALIGVGVATTIPIALRVFGRS